MCERHGYAVISQPGDGLCLFHALSHNLQVRQISETTGPQLKRSLQQHAVSIEPVLTEFLTEGKVSELSRWCKGTVDWDSDIGDIVALIAADFLRAHIVIFRSVIECL